MHPAIQAVVDAARADEARKREQLGTAPVVLPVTLTSYTEDEPDRPADLPTT